MQTSNYWKQFEHTGRVEDYLSYVSSETFVSRETLVSLEAFVPLEKITSSDISVGTKILGSVQTEETEGNKREKAGANPYAGIHMCNRNDIETGAYRGI